MMSQFYMKEDKLPSTLPVIFSTKIMREINGIDCNNQSNVDGLSEWHNYLDGVERYLSNPAIAFDYTNRFSRFPNGARFIRDFNINVGYKVITDDTTSQQCVYIFMMNLNLEEFGLNVPSTANESKQRMETIRKAILPILEFNQRLSMIR